MVNPPDYVYAVSAIPAVKRVAGAPSPRRLRALGGAPTPMEVERIDARTLRVRLDGGLFDLPFSRYFRSPALRFAAGDRVELSDFSVEVAGLNEAGDPADLLFRFGVPLEDASLRWLAWSDGAYRPWQPPAVGRSVRVRPPQGIFE